MLDETDSSVATERNSRKRPLDDAEAAKLLDRLARLVIARGRSVREIAGGDATIDDLKGPTGNYRAPMVQVGETLLVGFHEDSLRSLLA